MSKSAAERFWAKVDKNGPVHPTLGTRCWLWTGSLRHGYGQFWAGRPVAAHRFSFLLAGGVIPEGEGVLHKCDNSPCVNPDHHFTGTDAVNMADRDAKGRGFCPPALANAAKTRCKKGHPFNAENTHYYKGKRFCRACNREYSRRRVA